MGGRNSSFHELYVDKRKENSSYHHYKAYYEENFLYYPEPSDPDCGCRHYTIKSFCKQEEPMPDVKFLDQVREQLRLRHYSYRTEETYLDQTFHAPRVS